MARGRNGSEDLSMLQMALVGFNIEKQRIEARIQEIQTQLGGRRGAPANAGTNAAPRKRELSADARRRIAMAQKRRWAEHRKRAAQAAKGQSAKAGAAGAQ